MAECRARCIILILAIGVVAAYRGTDNRLASSYGDDRHFYDVRIPEREYHYPDIPSSNRISRGHVVRYVDSDHQSRSAVPWHRAEPPPFSGHVNHVRRKSQPHGVTAGLYRVSQWGSATIPYMGAVVNVHPLASRQKTYRGVVTTTILSPDEAINARSKAYPAQNDIGRTAVQDEPALPGHEACFKCPGDRSVVAPRGVSKVLMEKPVIKPCHHRSWSPDARLEILSGQRAGSPLHEGTHAILSRIVYRHKTLQTCHFRYTVIVRKCPPLVPSDQLSANCTASNTWGSECRLSCAQGYQPLGPTTTQCGDNQRWTQPLPHCISVSGCSMPTSPENGRLSCTTPEENDLGDLITEGTTCRYVCDHGYFMSDEHASLAKIECINGEWNNTDNPTCQDMSTERPVVLLESSGRPRKHRHRKTRDPCRPNPCTRDHKCFPIPDPTMALCTCRPALAKPGQACNYLTPVERKKKKKGKMGQVTDKSNTESEFGD